MSVEYEERLEDETAWDSDAIVHLTYRLLAQDYKIEWTDDQDELLARLYEELDWDTDISEDAAYLGWASFAERLWVSGWLNVDAINDRSLIEPAAAVDALEAGS